VLPGELTSQAGWPADTPRSTLEAVIDACRGAGIRTSLFVEASAPAIRWAAAMGADRVELYTEPYARAHERGEGEASYQRFAEAATLAHELGLGVNAGHDLDLQNLPRFRALPYLDEVSIGHALMSRALFVGLATVVREYLEVLRAPERSSAPG
jgi:pyridoxine 5-phosphate synthase